MQNPIPKSNLFATPEDLGAILAFISRMPKGQRVEAMMVVQMTLNWANKEVQKELDAELV